MYTKIFCSKCHKELRIIFPIKINRKKEYIHKDSALTYRPINFYKMVEYDECDFVEYDYEEEYINYKCDSCNTTYKSL